jgi:hypothetical protein
MPGWKLEAQRELTQVGIARIDSLDQSDLVLLHLEEQWDLLRRPTLVIEQLQILIRTISLSVCRRRKGTHHGRQSRPACFPSLLGDIRITHTLLPLLLKLVHDRSANNLVVVPLAIPSRDLGRRPVLENGIRA